jgi:dTDP-4-amino-4,6-dideoxygalactose transaminase
MIAWVASLAAHALGLQCKGIGNVITTKLAIDGGAPVRTTPLPEWPIAGKREEELLLEVLHSGKWGSLHGEKVNQFAAAFAAYQGAAYGICVSNGTVALQLALKALGVGPGDEVITTPYTFVATPSAALFLGAKPVFVDIDPATCNIDPTQIERAITPRTKAIVPVHLAGQPADMDGVMAVAEAHGLRVLEDACQAWGAEWRGRRVGTIGDAGCFSFQSSKNLNAGEGGIVVTNDPELAEICLSLHNVGRIRDGGWYQHELLGWNFRMTEWQGAILLAQLERLPAQEAAREAAAAYLDEVLSGVPGVSPTTVDPRVTRHGHHLYLVRYHAEAFGGRPRDEFLAALMAEGIDCINPGYVPLTDAPAIRNAIGELFGEDAVREIADCPAAHRLTDEIFWLQQTALLGSQEDLDSIAEAIGKIQRAWG